MQNAVLVTSCDKQNGTGRRGGGGNERRDSSYLCERNRPSSESLHLDRSKGLTDSTGDTGDNGICWVINIVSGTKPASGLIGLIKLIIQTYAPQNDWIKRGADFSQFSGHKNWPKHPVLQKNNKKKVRERMG